MTGYTITNLKKLIGHPDIGEDLCKEILSGFSCPLNGDVENFIKTKAIPFAKQGIGQTHIVWAPYKNKPVICGYYTLATKFTTIPAKHLSGTWRRRISRFAQYDQNVRGYPIAIPLIGQLGKNYTNGYNTLVAGNELLKLACDTVAQAQINIGGKLVYVECEDKPKLVEFYQNNGFFKFDERPLDFDEKDHTSSNYYVQLLKYI